jgi:hypothetical protein
VPRRWKREEPRQRDVPSTNKDQGGALLRRTTGVREMDGLRHEGEVGGSREMDDGEVAGGEPEAGGASRFAH